MILVTGANGLVGRAVAARLARSAPDGVRLALRDGRAAPAGSAQIARIPGLDADTDWRAALAGIGCVVHTAARVHMMRDTAPDPAAEFQRINVSASLNLARQAAACGVRRLVFLSSIKVNGERTLPGRPFRADDPAAPSDDYGRSKWQAEQGLADIARVTGLEVVVIRPPLVYGPGVRANFLSLMRLVRRCPVLPLGAVANLRSYVALENLVDLIDVCTGHPAAANQTFLVSDGADLSTPALVRGLARAMHRKIFLPSVPVTWLTALASLTGQAASVARLCESLQLDIAPTCARLGWSPPQSVADGLAAAVAGMEA